MKKTKIEMKYKIGTKINFERSIPAMSCEWNGRSIKDNGTIVGYEKANGTMMYVVDIGHSGLKNLTLVFESEIKG